MESSVSKRQVHKALFLLLMMLLYLLSGKESVRADDGTEELSVYFFYNNPCESCDEFGKFMDFFLEQVEDIPEKPDFRLYEVNGFRDANHKFNQICETLEIPPELQNQPMVVIGDHYLSGQAKIDTNLKEFFIECMEAQEIENPSLKEILLRDTEEDSNGEASLPPPPDLVNINPERSTVIFFYTSACSDCRKAKDYLAGLPISYSIQQDGKMVESFINPVSYHIGEGDNLAVLNHFFTQYQVPQEQRKVPIVFYQNGYFSGYEAISNGLQQVLSEGGAMGFTWQAQADGVKKMTWADLPTALVTGLVNGFNPCSISMLFFLMSLLLVKNANVLKLGFTYICAKTVTYFLIGTVLYAVIGLIDNAVFSSINTIVNGVLIVLLFGLVVLNISDFIASKNERYDRIRLQLPAGFRDWNQKIIAKFTEKSNQKTIYITVFVLGCFISLGEFLCTGQIYLATILYFLQRSTGLDPVVITAFILYVLAMSLPLMAITIFIHRGKRVLLLSEKVRQNMPVIKLANAAVFLLLAIAIFFMTFVK